MRALEEALAGELLEEDRAFLAARLRAGPPWQSMASGVLVIEEWAGICVERGREGVHPDRIGVGALVGLRRLWRCAQDWSEGRWVLTLRNNEEWSMDRRGLLRVDYNVVMTRTGIGCSNMDRVAIEALGYNARGYLRAVSKGCACCRVDCTEGLCELCSSVFGVV